MSLADLHDEKDMLEEIAGSDEEIGVYDEATESKSSEDTDEIQFGTSYEINSYGADYDVEGLVKRLNRNDIYIPSFQRRFVWSLTDSSRFIESLLLGFPVPAIFLSKEANKRFLVVDGQQRLISLQSFYKGLFIDRKFKLAGVNSRFSGKTYEDLGPEDKRRLDDALIHSIIVEQTNPQENDQVKSSIYLLFERLNSGGRPLFAQEIRSCVDHGDFIDLLRELNEFDLWRKIFGKKSKRLKDEELILRFLALYFDLDNYAQPMKTFLNNYCSTNRTPSNTRKEELSKLFKSTVRCAHEAFGDQAFRPQKAFNAAVFDSIGVALARRLSKGPITQKSELKSQYDALIEDENFRRAYSSGTSRDDQVSTRIRMASEAFEKVE
jgi:hypothetical protein